MLEKCKHASSLEDFAIWHLYLGSDGMENLMINIIYVTYTLIVQLYQGKTRSQEYEFKYIGIGLFKASHAVKFDDYATYKSITDS